MFPHPDTICALKEMDCRALLAEAAANRRAAEARPAAAGLTALAAAMRWESGSALIAVGRRLQGAEPAGREVAATAGSSVAS